MAIVAWLPGGCQGGVCLENLPSLCWLPAAGGARVNLSRNLLARASAARGLANARRLLAVGRSASARQWAQHGVSPEVLVVALVVPGEPVPKRRARTFYDARVGRIVSKNTDRVVAAETHVANCLKIVYPHLVPLPSGRLGIIVRCHLKGVGRGDWDNYAKLPQDALNGIVYRDDKQVRRATVELVDHSSEPRTEIAIYRLEGVGS
jgi:Holliday junction resolvase RusA-like endonuclease